MTILMKDFIRNHKHDDATLTVAELIEVLSRYPAHTPVCASWEGQVVPVNANEIKLVDDERLFSRPFVDINVD